MNLRRVDRRPGDSAARKSNSIEGTEDMSDLVCMAFDDPDAADLALDEIQGMQKEHLVDLQDACVVVRDAGGKVHLKQSVRLVKPAATGGAGFDNGSRAISGATAGYGISRDFIRQLGSTIAPDTSALFVLFRRVDADQALPELSEFDGRVPQTSLSDADEDRLREALSRIPEPAA
jgi:uncharacterized membrane protein